MVILLSDVNIIPGNVNKRRCVEGWLYIFFREILAIQQHTVWLKH